MADTYWDPANLFQITDSYNAPEIQCIGRVKNRHASRCRNTISGSDATAILAKLKKMAGVPPAKVAQQDIDSLAKLCLCRETHFAQWSQVAQRWKPAVTRAVKHHDRLSKANPTAERAQLEALHQERRKCLDILNDEEDGADLTTKISAYLLKDAEEKVKIEGTVSHLQGDLSAAHAAISDTENRLWEVEAELHRGKERENELNADCLAAVVRVEETHKVEEARLKELLAKLDRSNSDRTKLELLVSDLQDKVGSTSHWLQEERSKVKALEEAKSDLEHQLAETAEAAAHSERLLDEEITKTRALQEDKVALGSRFIEANQELESTRRLLEEETNKAKLLQEKRDEFERRMGEAYTMGDHLVGEERIKSKELRETKEDLERACHEDRTRIRALSEIRDELKQRLSEARASSAAEVDKARCENETLSQQCATAVEEVRQAKNDLNKANTSVERLSDERLVLERELQQLRVNFQALQSTNQSLHTDNLAMKSQLTGIESSVTRRWRARLGGLLDKEKKETKQSGNPPPAPKKPASRPPPRAYPQSIPSYQPPLRPIAPPISRPFPSLF